MKNDSNKVNCPDHSGDVQNEHRPRQNSGPSNIPDLEKLEQMYLRYSGFPTRNDVTDSNTENLDLQDLKGRGETILFAEDNQDVAKVVRLFLENGGYKPIVVHNGKDALEIYREKGKDISLVILDLRMPVMTGQDCIRELLKIDPTVKVLALSGYYQKQEVMQQIGNLIKGFIPKPCRSNALLKQARYALGA